MRALRWILITVAVITGLLVIGIAIGGAWLNTFIHSEAFKTEVESRAARSLGGTVKIGAVDFNVFTGVKLQQLAAQVDPSHSGGQGALQMQVASVNCTYAWKELLNRKLKLTGITLDQPQIVLTKQPTERAEPQPQPGGLDSGATQGEGAAMPFQFILDSAKINDGAVSIRDASGTAMVELKGVNASADTSGYYDDKDVTGTLKVADMALPSSLRVTDFSTPFTYRAGAIEAKPFKGSAFNGNVAGSYLVGTTGSSILDLNGKGFDVAQFTTSATSNSSMKLTGTLDMQSKWRGVETGVVNGEGDVQMANGKLAGVKILESLGSILRINELTQPIIITQAKSHFLVQNQQTQLTGLQVTSPLFQMTGGGTVGFNGALNLDLVMVLSRDVMAKMPKEIASSFVQAQDGTGSIGFKVTGTQDNPQTDLPQRLLMQNTKVQDVINKALNKFFH